MKPLSPCGAAALRIVDATHGINTNAVGFRLRRLGLVKAANLSGGNLVLAAESVLRALDRRGLVRPSQSSHDQWAVKVWYLTDAGREAMAALGDAPDPPAPKPRKEKK